MFYDTYSQLCKNKGVTASKAATDMGINKSTVTYWKASEKAPNGTSLNKIAEYFNVSVDYLLGKTDIKEKPSEIEGFSNSDIAIAKKIQSLTKEQRLKLEGYVDSLLGE